MQTLKLRIKKLSNPELIAKMQQDYSYAFRKLYKCFGNLTDYYVKKFRKDYNLDSWQYKSILIDVEAKINQVKTIINKNEEKIKQIKQELKIEKDKRITYKLIQKLKQTNKFKDIVFGSSVLLKRISFLCNNKTKNHQEIKKIKHEFEQKKLLPIFIMGESYANGNRKFKLELPLNKVSFRPHDGISVNIEFFCSKNRSKILAKLQEASNKNYSLPISIRLSTEYIWITFDEEKLNGYGLNERDLNKERKNTPKENNKQKAWIVKKFHKEKENKKLFGKIPYRFLAVDLNPQYIGWCICDLIDGKIRIVKTGCYDLSKLSNKLKLSGSDPKQKSQNKKRKFEICNIFKDLFKKATHYKAAYFVNENFYFKSPIINKCIKDFNRKVKNIWHRTLITNLITKHCNVLGIQKIEIDPKYTSFIGNIKHQFIDPVNASIEICRRGPLTKIAKSSFLPRLTEDDFDTMSRLIYQSRDVQNKTELDQKVRSLTRWGDLFYFFAKTKFKYRRSLEDLKKDSYKEFSLFSLKSKVTLFEFAILNN